LKFRYTWGISGNSNTNSRFLFMTRINNDGVGGYQFGIPGSTVGYGGYEEGQVGSDVSWETAERQNLGFEIKLFRSRLSLIADLFKEYRTGILLRQMDMPYSSGFTTNNIPYGNV